MRPVTVSRPAGAKTYAIKTGQGPVSMHQQPLLQPPTPQQQLQLQQHQQTMLVNAAGQQIRHTVQGGQVMVPHKSLPSTGGTVAGANKASVQNKIVNAASLQNKSVPSVLNKGGVKEKEKKTFSSAGYA